MHRAPVWGALIAAVAACGAPNHAFTLDAASDVASDAACIAALSAPGACVAAAPDPVFACRAIAAGASGSAASAFSFFGVNAGRSGAAGGSAESTGAMVSQLLAGFVRIGIDTDDRDPHGHLAVYAARVRDFHRYGIRVLFDVTEGLVPIPTNPDGSGMYAKDSCSTDPRVASLWTVGGTVHCGCDATCVHDIETAWGISTAGGSYASGSYMDRFRTAFAAFVMDFDGGDPSARPDEWEILNEPDNNAPRTGHPYGTQLNVMVTGEILKIARGVVDAANARYQDGERLAFGALMSSSAWRITAASAILAGGPVYDHASYHVYVPPSQAVASVLDGVDAMSQGAGGKPLIISEFGFTTTAPAGSQDAGSVAIGAFLAEAWRLRSQVGRPLDAAMLFSWADGDGGPGVTLGAADHSTTCPSQMPHRKAAFAAFTTAADAAQAGASSATCAVCP